jgi:MYXO-CTERM domain-containing protein
LGFVGTLNRALGAGVLALVVAGAVALVPSEAAACGGTFCDANLPTEMPVDQTGETILFAIDNGYVEAHVQIEYDGGDADQFAWIVPVPEVPEIEVGSWRLVQAVLDGTRPVYGFQNDNSLCEDPSPADGGGVVFLSAPDGGGSTGEPTVLAQDVVGAFEYAVLQGGSAATVTQWLAANDYAVQDEAPAILDQYIAEGHVFVAFRLRHGQGVEDIHPVVIRYPGVEPCIPIRLTRVAARENMDIRALFLGQARVVPTTFRHVLLNRTRLDWLNLGINYKELVTMAVDAPMANGRAFVTEYAGTSAVVDASLLDTTGLDAGAFAGLPVVEVIDVLEGMGLAECGAAGCEWYHELVSSLVHEFVPVPAGVDEAEFYACLSCYAGLIDLAAWDSAAFAAAFTERIVAPLQHGADLLATWPYVTRLYTVISPHEMTVDPMFAENPALPDVANRNGAQRERYCCGDAMALPGGRRVWLPGNSWPSFENEMPWAERIEEYAKGGGAPIVIVDHGALIDTVLDHWNAVASCLDGGGTGSTGGDAGLDGDGLGDAGDGTAGSTGSTGGPGADEPTPGGCACATGSGSGGLGWGSVLLGLGLGGVIRRRRA